MTSILDKFLALLLAVGTLFGGGTQPPAPPTAPEPISQAPREIRYRMSASFTTLDPTFVTNSNDMDATTHLFEGLVRNTANGPIPGMAERWEVSKDGTEYVFHLRDGLRWSNGEPLTADDFVYAWTRALDPETGSDYAYQLYYLKGGAALNSAKPENVAEAKAALGVKALDAKTLEVTLEAPTPYFLYLAGFTTLHPVPRKVVEANPQGWADRPESLVSNGPFMLQELSPGREAVFVKNPYYWNKAAVSIERLRFIEVFDSNTTVMMFNYAELDAASGVAVADMHRVMPGSVHSVPAFGSTYYVLNTKVKPFDDLRVRRALSLSLDRQAILDTVNFGNRALYALVPAGAPDLTQGSDFRKAGGPLITEDLSKAKQLLAEAGYPDGRDFPAVELLVSRGGVNEQIAATMVNQWQERLGISTIQITAPDVRRFMERKQEGSFGLARAGWFGDYPDAMTFLDLWQTGGMFNDAGYANPEYDALIERAKATADQKVRMAAMHQAEALLLYEMPIIPLYEMMNTYVQSPRLTGVYWDMFGSVDFTYAELHD